MEGRRSGSWKNRPHSWTPGGVVSPRQIEPGPAWHANPQVLTIPHSVLALDAVQSLDIPHVNGDDGGTREVVH
jgi:hypothetical protein